MRDHPPEGLTPTEVVAAGHRGDFAVVERAAASSDPLLRHAAVGSFHRLKTLSTERLLAFLADENPQVRHRACEIAARAVVLPEHGEATVDVPVIIDSLVRRLTDEPLVAEVAAFALGESATDDSDVVVALESMARDHDEHLCREAAVAALGSLGAGLATILLALEDRATIRRRAVIALAPFEGPEVEAALRAALEDRDWQVRQAAEDLLAEPDDDVNEGLDAD